MCFEFRVQNDRRVDKVWTDSCFQGMVKVITYRADGQGYDFGACVFVCPSVLHGFCQSCKWARLSKAGETETRTSRMQRLRVPSLLNNFKRMPQKGMTELVLCKKLPQQRLCITTLYA